MGILIFCIICIIICISIFGIGIGLLISIPGCIIGLVVWSFIMGPETRHEEIMDELREINDNLDDRDFDQYYEQQLIDNNKPQLEIKNSVINIDARSININNHNTIPTVKIISQDTIQKLNSFLIDIKEKYNNIYASISNSNLADNINLFEQINDDILFFLHCIKLNYNDLDGYTESEKRYFSELFTALKKFMSFGSKLNWTEEKIVSMHDINYYLELYIENTKIIEEDEKDSGEAYFPISLLFLYYHDLKFYEKIISNNDTFLTKSLLSLYFDLGNELINCPDTKSISKKVFDIEIKTKTDLMKRWFNEHNLLNY